MTRYTQLLILLLVLTTSHAANQFTPPPLPSPPPFPTTNPATSTTGRSSVNLNPYIAFGVQYPNQLRLPPLEVNAGLDQLLGTPLGVRIDLQVADFTKTTARANALLHLGTPANLYLAAGPRWGHRTPNSSNSTSSTYYGLAVGVRTPGKLQLQLELRADTPLNQLNPHTTLQLSALYHP